MSIRIEHDHENGTLLYGSRKGDGVLELVRPFRFKWFRSLGLLGIPNSRDRIADRYRIGAAADALRNAGFEVEVAIDDNHRPREQVLADKAGRLDERREALEAKAQRHAAKAAGHHQAADQIASSRPLGQPILVGHHSERCARADQDRIDRNMRKAIDEDAAAQNYAQRAQATGSGLPSQHPVVTARRIERAEAELRDIDRKLDGYQRRRLNGRGEVRYVEQHNPAKGRYRDQLEARRAQLVDQLAYDRGVLHRAKADGRWVEYGPADVHRGDIITARGRHRRVVKVNKKTVSVETGYSWTDKVPFLEIQQITCNCGDGAQS